jgi:hypothetical protein
MEFYLYVSPKNLTHLQIRESAEIWQTRDKPNRREKSETQNILLWESEMGVEIFFSYTFQ